MSARQQIADALTSLLKKDGYRAIVPRNLDPLEPKSPVVVVIPDTLTPTGYGRTIEATFALYAITPKQLDPDDDLDVIVQRVIDALDSIPWLVWIDAERTTFNDKHAYRIRVQAKTERK